MRPHVWAGLSAQLATYLAGRPLIAATEFMGKRRCTYPRPTPHVLSTIQDPLRMPSTIWDLSDNERSEMKRRNCVADGRISPLALFELLCTERLRQSHSTQSIVWIHSLHDKHIRRQVFNRRSNAQFDQSSQKSFLFRRNEIHCTTSSSDSQEHSDPDGSFLLIR